MREGDKKKVFDRKAKVKTDIHGERIMGGRYVCSYQRKDLLRRR